MPSQTTARDRLGLPAAQSVRIIFNAFLDLVFPPRCVHCGRVDTSFCDDDRARLEAFPVYTASRLVPELEAVATSGAHQGILQSAVQALKYYNVRDLAQPLAKRLVQVIDEKDWTFDMVIPVPMHTSRLRQRGYNQAEEIAQVVADMIVKPCVPQAIIRQRATRSQVGLNQRERRQNLIDAFVADAALVQGQRLLLVDDVLTTGTTLSACAQAALAQAATHVYGLTVTQA